MALSNEDLEQILDAISKESWKLQTAWHRMSDIPDVIPALGELISLSDERALAVGNGVDKIGAVVKIPFTTGTVTANTQPAGIAEAIWNDLKARTALGEVKSLLMPNQVFQEFLKKKPANFSWMNGDAIHANSPFKQFMANSPNSKGDVLRNYHHGDTNRDDANRIIGHHQDFAVQKETGNAQGGAGGGPLLGLFITNDQGSGSVRLTKGSPVSVGGGSSFSLDTLGLTIDNSRNVRTSTETRMNNTMVIMVWRTY